VERKIVRNLERLFLFLYFIFFIYAERSSGRVGPEPPPIMADTEKEGNHPRILSSAPIGELGRGFRRRFLALHLL